MGLWTLKGFVRLWLMDLTVGSRWVLGKFKREEEEYLIGLRTLSEDHSGWSVHLAQGNRVQFRNPEKPCNLTKPFGGPAKARGPRLALPACTEVWHGGLSHFLVFTPPLLPEAGGPAGPAQAADHLWGGRTLILLGSALYTDPWWSLFWSKWNGPLKAFSVKWMIVIQVARLAP